jgi:hypothetical protein
MQRLKSPTCRGLVELAHGRRRLFDVESHLIIGGHRRPGLALMGKMPPTTAGEKKGRHQFSQPQNASRARQCIIFVISHPLPILSTPVSAFPSDMFSMFHAACFLPSQHHVVMRHSLSFHHALLNPPRSLRSHLTSTWRPLSMTAEHNHCAAVLRNLWSGVVRKLSSHHLL